MDWLDVYWDADIESHLKEHEVSRADFEQVVRNLPITAYEVK